MNSLGAKALNGMAWSLAQGWFSRSIGLIVFILLSRLLDTADFGIVAMGLVFHRLSSAIPESVVFQRTVQRPEAEENYLRTAFTGSLIYALIILFGAWLSADYIARVSGFPTLSNILPAIGFVAFLECLACLPRAIVIRRMQYRDDALRRGTASALGGCLAVGFAYLGFGIWALVIHLIAQAAVNLALIWHFSRWRVQLGIHKEVLPDLVNFGGYLILFRLLGMIRGQAPTFLIGLFWGAETLGFFTIARRFFNAVNDSSFSAVNRVTLSIFSRASDFNKEVRDIFPTSLFALSVFFISPMLALSLLSDVLVQLFFGKAWMPSGETLSFLLVAGAFGATSVFCSQVLLASGKPEVAVKIRMVLLPFVLTLFYSVGPISPDAIPISLIAVSVVTTCFLVTICKLELKLSLAALTPCISSFGISIFCFLVARITLIQLDLHGPVELTLLAASMMALSIFIHFVVVKQQLRLLALRLSRNLKMLFNSR